MLYLTIPRSFFLPHTHSFFYRPKFCVISMLSWRRCCNATKKISSQKGEKNYIKSRMTCTVLYGSKNGSITNDSFKMNESFYGKNWFRVGKWFLYFTFIVSNFIYHNWSIKICEPMIKNYLSIFSILVLIRIHFRPHNRDVHSLISILPDFVCVFYHKKKNFTFYISTNRK